MKFNYTVTLSLLAFIAIGFAIKSLSYEHGSCLKSSYETYKTNFMTNDGRIMDPDRNYITTSEGQSYMLLRSFLSNDKKTFDLVYNWSKENIQREDDLFSWLWGKSKDGTYKILDYNSASDADIDIAFALILAHEKWGDEKYLENAIPIINSIWDYETKQINNYLVLMPGANQTLDEKIEINPSYFSPYAFKIFQKYDNRHNWNELVDSSYYYLQQVITKTQTGLPPDWFLIENDQIVLEKSNRSDFSYDAIRVFARIYMDFIFTKDQRAIPILEKSQFFAQNWNNTKKLYVNYQADGKLRDKNEFVGSIAILVPVINLYDEKTAEEIYSAKIIPVIKNKDFWLNKANYYSENLLWFGCYFYKK